MLTDEERKVMVANKVRRSHETWVETKGILPMERHTQSLSATATDNQSAISMMGEPKAF